MNLFIIRHTEYENPENIYPGRLSLNLSLLGRQHAKRIGQWLMKRNFKHIPIYSSPVTRTIQTAEIIACHTESMVYTDKNIIEVWYSWQGKPITVKLGSSDYYQQPHKEKPEKVLRRVKRSLVEKINLGNNCILMTHGDPATYLYRYLCRKPLNTLLLDSDYVQMGEIIWLTYINKQLQKIQRIVL